MPELRVADVRAQVLLSLFSDFENFSVFKPGPSREESVTAMLDEVLAWVGALRNLRLSRFQAASDESPPTTRSESFKSTESGTESSQRGSQNTHEAH
jgi:hypothetical protein